MYYSHFYILSYEKTVWLPIFYWHYACNKHIDMRYILTKSSKCRRRVDISESRRCKWVCVCVCDNQTGLSCLSSCIYSDVTHNTIAEKENFHATSGFMKYCQRLRGFTWSVIVINGFFTLLRAFLNEIKLHFFIFGILDHFNCTCTSKKEC